MPETEIRESQHSCPRCGTTLREVWKYGPDGSLVSRLEWQRVGRPSCPQGHRLEWTVAGTPV
jgi:hypothetical protein